MPQAALAGKNPHLSAFFTMGACLTGQSADSKIEEDIDQDVHGRVSDASRNESPLADSDDRFLVQTVRVERPGHANRNRDAFTADDDYEGNGPLKPLAQGVGGVVRPDSFNSVEATTPLPR